MKFALHVLDMFGAEKPVGRGPKTDAEVGLLSELEATAFFAPAQKLMRPLRLATMLPESPPRTHKHAGDGRYESPSDFPEGKYLLVVCAKGKAPVYQRLTLKDNKGAAIAKVGWGGPAHEANLLAHNVELPIGAQGRNVKQDQRTLVTVKLVPRVEYVFVATTGFWHETQNDQGQTVKDGTFWGRFAQVRRQRLWELGEMMGGHLITIFFCELGRRQTFVKAAGDATKWLRIHELLIKKPRPVGVAQWPLDPEDDIGIIDLYRYLDAVGAAHRGTVWEVSFFGHAWQQGPTFSPRRQDEPYKSNDERDPKDLDARRKDWKPTIRNTFKTLTAAHLYKAVWRVWGCNCDTEAQDAIGAAQRQLKPKFDRLALFRYKWNIADKKVVQQAIHQLPLSYLLRRLRNGMRASYVLNVPVGVGQLVGCFAALPGFGAQLVKSGDMRVTDSKKLEDGSVAADIENDGRFDFYLRELGPDSKWFMDRSGYFEQRFVSEAIANWGEAAFHHGRFYMRDISKDVAEGPRWEVQVASGARVISTDKLVKLTKVERRSGLGDPGKEGHLFWGSMGRVARVEGGSPPKIMLEQADDTECAVFMQQDGKLFALTRGSDTEAWSVDKRDIARSGGQPSPIKNGVLHVNGDVIW